ncbi:hypothetical protein RB620_24845 [Paenibacillus sp. LHD-117]|uniref:hypothetical protein n=1 Tax=Paenibacillus sp. LHD-117 TaxID=3071412 RepID=UPI0027E18833|nr:hypothetical protein [Paenibacillus sp. LHD-117]MDQ6422666.1 hypothetical protein [Paenibacillus sp. LHD-117]
MDIKQIFGSMFKTRTVLIPVSRSDYYKLQMICEGVNQSVDADDELTPDIIAGRVLSTFIREAYEDSTNRIVHQIVPEARYHRRKRQF